MRLLFGALLVAVAYGRRSAVPRRTVLLGDDPRLLSSEEWLDTQDPRASLVVQIGANDHAEGARSASGRQDVARQCILRGWRGLLFEPDPHAHARLRARYANVSGRVRTVQAAACPRDARPPPAEPAETSRRPARVGSRRAGAPAGRRLAFRSAPILIDDPLFPGRKWAVAPEGNPLERPRPGAPPDAVAAARARAASLRERLSPSHRSTALRPAAAPRPDSSQGEWLAASATCDARRVARMWHVDVSNATGNWGSNRSDARCITERKEGSPYQ